MMKPTSSNFFQDIQSFFGLRTGSEQTTQPQVAGTRIEQRAVLSSNALQTAKEPKQAILDALDSGTSDEIVKHLETFCRELSPNHKIDVPGKFSTRTQSIRSFEELVARNLFSKSLADFGTNGKVEYDYVFQLSADNSRYGQRFPELLPENMHPKAPQQPVVNTLRVLEALRKESEALDEIDHSVRQLVPGSPAWNLHHERLCNMRLKREQSLFLMSHPERVAEVFSGKKDQGLDTPHTEPRPVHEAPQHVAVQTLAALKELRTWSQEVGAIDPSISQPRPGSDAGKEDQGLDTPHTEPRPPVYEGPLSPEKLPLDVD